MRPLATHVLIATFAVMFPVMASVPSPTPGVVFGFEVKDSAAAAPSVVMVSIEGLNLKMEIPPSAAAGRADIIFHGDRKEWVMVDHGRRTYAVLDQASISQMAVRMGELMQEQMKKLPPEQRAMVEQMLKGRGMAMSAAPVTPTEFRRTPERAQQSGYDAVKNDVLRDGKVVFTMWSADWNAVEGAAEARPALESMASFIEEIPSDLTNLVGELQALRHMKAMNGFPVLTVTYRDGRPGSEARLVSAASRTLLADTFETPAGFTQERIR